MKYVFSIITISILLIAPSFTSTTSFDPPEELGKVDWLRNIKTATLQASKTDKPILILFQEVPGCSTCRNYGNDVLSHPLLVEAIETLFVPLAIHNNKQGEDARVLKSFGEPSWNNPVVRIVNKEKKDIVARLGSNYSKAGLIQTMIAALEASENEVPYYLRLLNDEFTAQQSETETATVAMACFWTGEGALGAIDGVVKTEAGWMSGKEVVRLEYDPEIVSYESILQQAKKDRVAYHVFTNAPSQVAVAKSVIGNKSVSKKDKFRLDRDPKYYLSRTHYKFLPMTEIQAARVNHLIGKRIAPDEVLSPRQIELANFIKENKSKNWEDAIHIDFVKAWYRAIELVR